MNLDFYLFPLGLKIADDDLDLAIRTRLHQNAVDPAHIINEHIQARSAYRSGALVADEKFEANFGVDDDVLIYFFTGSENQIAEYGRTYARFIEGPYLGFDSPTIANPSHMYANVLSDDLPILRDWAEEQIRLVTDMFSQNSGL